MESVQHLRNVQTLKTLGTMALHSFVTLPSFIMHSAQNKYASFNKSNICAGNHLQNANILLFVHGMNGSTTDFIPLFSNIKKNTCETNDIENSVVLQNSAKWYLHTVTLGNTMHTSLNQDADVLQTHINTYYTNCNITLVGLSKGGLVILRYALNDLDLIVKKNHIDKLITMSSPLCGTHSASLFPPTSNVFQSLSYECKAVKDIAEHHTKLNVYHIVPTWDNMIVPSSSAKFSDTHESHVYSYSGYYGHTGIAYHVHIAQIIIRWLME